MLGLAVNYQYFQVVVLIGELLFQCAKIDFAGLHRLPNPLRRQLGRAGGAPAFSWLGVPRVRFGIAACAVPRKKAARLSASFDQAI